MSAGAARAVVIINPVSGGASRATVLARVELARAQRDGAGDPVDVFVTERGGHARELAAAAAAAGARTVIAWGGDGTINEVASALAFSDVAMGIVPAGSGNGLARELGIATMPLRALQEALTASPRRIDAGEIEGRLFVNVAGVGVDAYVASRFSGARRRGFLGYVAITARALVTYKPVTYRITAGSTRVTAKALLVSIANSSQFGNGACIAPGARLDDGLLDLVVFEERWRLETLTKVPRLFDRTVDQVRGCTVRQVAEAVIAADEPLTFHVDGEPVSGGTELHVCVHPGALWLAVR